MHIPAHPAVAAPPSGGHRQPRLVAGAVIAVAILVAACSSSAATTVPSSSPGAGTSPAVGAAGPSPSAAPGAPGGGTALDLQHEFVSAIAAVSPSVVVIETSSGLGSGIVFDAKGDIVTNAHVVGSSRTFTVTLADGRQLKGTLVGTFASDDLAVVHVSGANLHPATFGDSSKLVVGDIVMAVGNPLGLQSSVTQGIVSAIGRTVSEPSGAALPDVIQTSADINPGNSGGALVDLTGRVVGIPTLAATDPQIGGSAPGIGFAISSNRAKLIADQLIASGKVTSSGRAYMGIQLRDAYSGGALVAAVSAGGPAAKAGLVAGDTITAVDGTSVPDSTTLVELIAAHKPGDTVKLSVRHADGKTATDSLTLGEAPA